MLFRSKEDKKSRIKKGDTEQDDNKFDIIRMRIERERQLGEAKQKPLLKKNKIEVVRYPYVFDGMSEAKKMAALVGGNKVNCIFEFLSPVQFLFI